MHIKRLIILLAVAIAGGLVAATGAVGVASATEHGTSPAFTNIMPQG
jgi:hypothetical protein